MLLQCAIASCQELRTIAVVESTLIPTRENQ
jgi:hypothetical protein